MVKPMSIGTVCGNVKETCLLAGISTISCIAIIQGIYHYSRLGARSVFYET
jgi:hypothetical protein